MLRILFLIAVLIGMGIAYLSGVHYGRHKKKIDFPSTYGVVFAGIFWIIIQVIMYVVNQ
jgi:hypothetical protein